MFCCLLSIFDTNTYTQKHKQSNTNTASQTNYWTFLSFLVDFFSWEWAYQRRISKRISLLLQSTWILRFFTFFVYMWNFVCNECNRWLQENVKTRWNGTIQCAIIRSFMASPNVKTASQLLCLDKLRIKLHSGNPNWSHNTSAIVLWGPANRGSNGIQR